MNVKRSTPVSLEVAVAEREYIIVEARELVTGSEPRYGEGPHRIITDGTSEPVFKALSRPVQPLEEDPALHRNFADLGENDQAFADFASRYGLLHGGLEVRLEVPGKTVN
ncbi:MAG: hypothetical protein FJY85_17790, partial [Deltaproteobacteria bacterium]|nr:hypothetical protein [Deltaproteobacteria bacterium]